MKNRIGDRYLVMSSVVFDLFWPLQQVCSVHCWFNIWICCWAATKSCKTFFLWISQLSWLTENFVLDIVSISENSLWVTTFAWPILLDTSFEIKTFVSLMIPGTCFYLKHYKKLNGCLHVTQKLFDCIDISPVKCHFFF